MNDRIQEKGAVLIVVLIFIIVATLFATGSMKTSIINQKITANQRDQDFAFQTAEASLLSVEAMLSNGDFSSSNFTDDCQSGLCLPNNTNPVWLQPNMWKNARELVDLGNDLSPASNPRYLIEDLSTSLGPGFYRITVEATGKTVNSKVYLQSVYAP